MRRALVWAIVGLALASPVAAQTRAQADSLRTELVRTCAFAKAADTQLTKAVAADSSTQDAQLTELIRSRGFVRGSITQCEKSRSILDRLLGIAEPPADTAPEPPPADTVIAPPLDTTPAPPPSDPGDAAFVDGFEAYPDGVQVHEASQGFGGFRWGNGNGDGAFVSSERARTGSKSLRFRFDDPGHVWAEQRMQFSPTPRELWLEYWLYVPANFVHPDPGPSNNKFIRVFGNDPNHAAGVRNVSGGASSLPDARGNHVNLQWGDIDTRFTINSGASFGWIGTTQQPGTWAQVRYHAKMSSARGVRDGLQRMWINGRLVAENRDIPWANPDVPGFDEGYLLGYDNSHYAEETVFFIDDFAYYTSDPGW